MHNNENVKTMRDFSIDFLEHSFGPLVESCYIEIETDSIKVEETDRIHLFVVIAFFLKLSRLLNKEKQRKESHD